MDEFDLIVVGGGISGLSLAHFASNAGYRTLLLEKEAQVGGALQSHVVEDGFWLEMGAHTCYNSYGRLLDIMEAKGLMDEIIPRQKVPWAFLQNDRVQSIFSRLRLLELLVSLPRLAFTNKAGQSVGQYYSAILGAKNYRHTVRPMLRAVVSQDPDAFPVELLFKKRPRRKEVLRSFTLKQGMGSLAQGIADGGGFMVQTGKNLQALNLSNTGATLDIEGGEKLKAKVVALAVPPATAAELLRKDCPEISEKLAAVGTIIVDSVGVALPIKRSPFPPVAGIVAENDRFYSIVSRDTVPHGKLKGYAFHFKPGLTREAWIRRITEVLGVAPAVLKNVLHKQNVLPSPVVGHAQNIAEMDGLLEGKPLLVTGNYFTGMAIEDCVGRSFDEAARLAAMLMSEPN